MKISVTSAIPKEHTVFLFAFENEKKPCGYAEQNRLIEDASGQGFTGKDRASAILHPKTESPAKQVVLIGLGSKKKISNETIRKAGAYTVKKALSLSLENFTVILPQILNDTKKETALLAEGSLLANYQFLKYKSQTNEPCGLKEIQIAVPKKDEDAAQKGADFAKIISDSVCFVRDMVNEPPSALTPSKFREHAETIASVGRESGISIKVYEKKEIESMGMGALLGVNRGSAEPPLLIHLHYKNPSAKKSVAFVGKGITFDSGGLSLKPAESMETMKMDMAGAASILGLFKAIPKLEINAEVHGIMAVTENMPGGKAYKPGDVLKTMNGKTIEVLNTDAEGRLVLADALSYAAKQNPDSIIDIATLTGACIIALGSLVAGAMGNNQELFNSIEQAGSTSGEKFWQLPLVEEYKEGLKSPVADIKNISSVRKEAGSIIGGLFLQEFVDGKPWIHLDIAGPAWTDKEFLYYSQGGTGFPTRTLIHYLLNI